MLKVEVVDEPEAFRKIGKQHLFRGLVGVNLGDDFRGYFPDGLVGMHESAVYIAIVLVETSHTAFQHVLQQSEAVLHHLVILA